MTPKPTLLQTAIAILVLIGIAAAYGECMYGDWRCGTFIECRKSV